MKKIEIVITMSGIGKRFAAAGYSQPKYMIEVQGRTLFDWSLSSLSGYNCAVRQYIFVVLKNNSYDVESFIDRHCRFLAIKNYQIIMLDEVTDGQATTALKAQQCWHKNNRLLIYNIDTFVEPGQMRADQLKGDGFLPCFRASGDHWSFAKVNENLQVIQVKEKKRISDFCTLGAYYFSSCLLYQQAYDKYFNDSRHLVNGEKYVAPLYNQLIKQGRKVFISDIPAEKVHVLGTPEEVMAFANR